MLQQSQLLPVALLVLLQVLTTLQNPLSQNYTDEVLRISKAAHIRAYLDEDVDPCRNFYMFACGKWGKLHPATKNGGKTAFLKELQEVYVRKSAEMLKDDSKVDTGVEKQLKDFYKSCRHVQQEEQDVKRLNLEAILKFVNFLGGWPENKSNSYYMDEYDWLNMIADLRRKLGVNILVGMEVVPDFEDINTHRIMVGAPKLPLGTKDAYLNKEHQDTRDKYKLSIESKLRSYFSEMPDAWAGEVAQQVLELEQQLAKGLPDNKELTLQQVTRIRKVADLKAAYGNYVDLGRYLNRVFNQTIYVQVYESPIDYMSTLVEVIENTTKLNIANYTMWRVLEHVDFASEANIAHNEVWCVRKTMSYFAHLLEYMFQRNYNSMPLINELQSVWADIKKTFSEQLQSSVKLNWVTQETRQKAAQKLDAMDLEFVTHNYENFAQELQGLNFKQQSYYENLLQVLQWDTQHKLAKLIEQPQPIETELKLPKYELTKNKILIPITFLQSRFFWDSSYPHALKYSTLGFLLAQEMLHGFDVVGNRYDSHGYQRAWWDSVSEYAFTDRVKCFDKQYAKYKFNGKDLSELQTQTTSIADNGGLAIAYQTYQKWLKYVAEQEHTAKETLPLLSYTQNQLFFISFAQLMCADYQDNVTVKELTAVPELSRVIGALANSVDFAREFKCFMGGKMNPEQKCAIY